MPIPICCSACGAVSRIPDKLYQTRLAGRKSKIRCRKCEEQIEVDGTAMLANAAGAEVSAPFAGARRWATSRRDSPPSLRAVAISTEPAPAKRARYSETPELSIDLEVDSDDARDDSDEPTLIMRDEKSSVRLRESVRPEPAPVPAPAPRKSPNSRKRNLGLAGAVFMTAALTGAVASLTAARPSPAPASQLPQAAVPAKPVQTAESAPTNAPIAEEVALAEVAPSESAPVADSPAHDQEALKRGLRWLMLEIDNCHRGGRAGGSATLTLTFAPSGKVRVVQLDGEPIASAPVSRCILAHAKALLVPPFSGEPFSVSQQFTLR